MSVILIVDDNPSVRAALELMFSVEGMETVCAATPAEALACQARLPVDLVIQDMNFSADVTAGGEGVTLFEALRRTDPDLPIVLLTAWTQLDAAVRLVKAGAADYLAKPWDDERLLTTARNLLALRRATRANRESAAARARARDALAGDYDLRGMVFASEAMQTIVAIACRVARADVPVLVTGASGVGKEKVAEIVHYNSVVRDGPFVRVNVGAFSPELVGAELFGAEAGAFTGAVKAREGRFEAADGGTLFLDEIGTLPEEGQVKLLRVLQTGQFERLGSTRTRQVKVRVVSATNANLAEAIKAGRFRDDLYYRLNVIELAIPPLAERRDDILPLASACLDAEHRLSPAAAQALQAWHWPGNVRELQNVVRRACLLATGPEIQPADLGAQLAGLAPVAAGGEPDREAVLVALARNRGMVKAAARDLGLSRQALYRRMEKFAIALPERGGEPGEP